MFETIKPIRLFLLKNFIKTGVEDRSFWIGGSDSDVEGSWRWLSGKAMRMGTPYWATNDYSDDGCGQV